MGIVRFKFDLKHKNWSGSTVDGYCYVHLRNIRTHAELIDTIYHESIHQILSNLKVRSLEEEEHHIMKQIEVEWY